MLLAIEHSTVRCSLAVLDGENTVMEKAWTEPSVRARSLFPMLQAAWNALGARRSTLDAIAVGLGPGSYSGLRMALAAAEGFAAPDATPLIGVSSAEALAWSTMQDAPAAAVTVIGDARRNRLWAATFRDFSTPAAAERFVLIPADALRAHLPRGGTVLSADTERLAAGPAGGIARTGVPKAVDVGRLALHRLRAGVSTPPPAPIYLHPPVFRALIGR
jgi:tRNA threonylcarbamoyladenosine biosynthesis protein TsaB